MSTKVHSLWFQIAEYVCLFFLQKNPPFRPYLIFRSNEQPCSIIYFWKKSYNVRLLGPAQCPFLEIFVQKLFFM